MDNKIGDLLLCKKDFLVFEKGRFYKVKEIKIHGSQYGKKSTISFENETYLLWYNNDFLTNLDYYVWEYFYTTAELREIQIDSILND